jgi:hypothetical protein
MNSDPLTNNKEFSVSPSNINMNINLTMKKVPTAAYFYAKAPSSVRK